MIVRNEAQRIERALTSVAGVITHAAILDTGSTDSTMEIIDRFCAAHSIDLILSQKPFENFSASRNTALELAKTRDAEYILLMDADMELRGEWPNTNLVHPVYRILQRHEGGLSYWN